MLKKMVLLVVRMVRSVLMIVRMVFSLGDALTTAAPLLCGSDLKNSSTYLKLEIEF